MQLILIGYMGSGKSVIGKELAEKLKVPFIDLDSYIEEHEQATIPEIFKQKGEIYFRKAEANYVRQLVSTQKSGIISLGGGTPCYAGNMQFLIDNCPNLFYLKASVQTLIERLKEGKSSRPLLADLNDAGLEEYIRKHLFERNFFYLQAPKNVVVDGKTVDEVVSEILKKLT